MVDQVIIPSLRAAGRFEAADPFNRVVDPAVFYSVEAIRTIPEMQGLNINIFSRVFEPIGWDETIYNTQLPDLISKGAVVISLIPRMGPPVYVLSTHLLSFPLIDGVSYERMCLIADMGPLPEDMADALDQAKTHMTQWLEANYGITSTVRLGTIPVIGYVSRQEHEIAEQTRQGKITDATNDVALVRDLQAKLVAKDAYIKQLEQKLGATP